MRLSIADTPNFYIRIKIGLIGFHIPCAKSSIHIVNRSQSRMLK